MTMRPRPLPSVERGWYPEFPPLFNELTPILFWCRFELKWRFPVTFRTFSDRERHRELWPTRCFRKSWILSHGRVSLVWLRSTAAMIACDTFCTEQLSCESFAQLTFRESLRDIEACLGAQPTKLYGWDFESRCEGHSGRC